MMIVTGRGWTMHHGDCLAVLPSLVRVGHVITDPPYSERVHKKQWLSASLAAAGDSRAASAHAGIGFDALTDETAVAVATECARLAERWSLVFCDLDGIDLWRSVLSTAGLDYVRTCIWDKVDGAPQFTGDRPANGAEAFVCAHPRGAKKWNGGGARNVFQFRVNAGEGGLSGTEHESKPHPTQKPIGLMVRIVGLFSDPAETVLDPFAGSGTTGVACIRLGRQFIGIERDDKHFALACERLRAEENFSTLGASRAGQAPLFGEVDD